MEQLIYGLGRILKLAVIMLVVCALIFPVLAENASAQNKTLNGAGATFPYPVYSQWAYKYNKLTGVKLNYQSIGSGGGIAQIKAETVDFGASDAPMKKEELDESGLIQFPMVMGGVVPVVNIKGIKPGTLKLTADIISDIFLGKITSWNDRRIAAINPGLNIPKRAITVVHRSDGSGTTWIFTNYLDKVSPEWHEKVGAGKAVSWPSGVGGKGNEGVSAYVQRINGAIGYVEFAYAFQNNLTHILLQNSAGKFVAPTIDSFQSAAAHADWINAPGFYMVLTDQRGDDSWPITGATFILMHKDQRNLETAKMMLDYFDWCFNHGNDIAKDLHYVPMPENIVQLIQKKWKTEITYEGNPVWGE